MLSAGLLSILKFLPQASLETPYMTFVSTFFAYLLLIIIASSIESNNRVCYDDKQNGG
jgi:ABC-type methionine transport system permease subunit